MTQESVCLFQKTSPCSLNDFKYTWPNSHFVFFRKLLLVHWMTSNMFDPIVILSFSENFFLFIEWPQTCLTQLSFCLFQKTSSCSLNDLKHAWPNCHFVFLRKLLLVHWMTSNMLDLRVILSFSENFSSFLEWPQVCLTQGSFCLFQKTSSCSLNDLKHAWPNCHFVFLWNLLLIY